MTGFSGQGGDSALEGASLVGPWEEQVQRRESWEVDLKIQGPSKVQPDAYWTSILSPLFHTHLLARRADLTFLSG